MSFSEPLGKPASRIMATSTATMASSSSVLGRAVRGGSYLFLQRVLTFALNSLVLRRLRLSVTGAVTVRLELALASVFLLRDGFRLAFLRMPSLDGDHIRQARGLQASSPVGGASEASRSRETEPAEAPTLPELVRPLVNVAWLSTAVSWAIASAIASFSLLTAGTSDQESELRDYPLVMAMYCAAAMVEALAEPMYVLAHCSVLVSWQVSAQGAAFLVRGLVQYACIFALDLGLLAYGLAELSYALTLLLVFAGLFWRRMRNADARDAFALDSMRQLLPRAPSKETGSWFQSELLVLLVPFSLQSGVKYLLTEGDKWVLSVFATFQNMGVYGIVFHLGSLVPRMVFLPIEEATKTIFSKLASSSESPEASNGRDLLLLLLKLMHLVGLTFSCFGSNYAPTLVLLLYGVEKARLGVGDALAVYCIYIHFLGLNGVCEAVVHAVGDKQQLMRLNKLMGGFFVIYALSALAFMQVLALGTVGIILANCVNMACRIIYCLRFLAKRFPGASTKRGASSWTFLCASLPDRSVVAAFVSSFVVTSVSKHVLLSESEEDGAFRWSESWARHAIHIVVGMVCLALVALTLFVKERRELLSQIALLRRSRSDTPASSDKKQHKE